MLCVADIPFECVLRVFDVRSRSVIFSTAGGDIPPDVAVLHVLRLYVAKGCLYVDVEVK